MSKLFLDAPYEDIALNMFRSMQETIKENGHNYANWLTMSLYFNKPFYEIAVVGEEYEEIVQSLQKNYLPNTVFAASDWKSKLALLQNRLEEGNTLIYVCQHGSCKLPVTTPAEVLEQIAPESENRQ